jgi:hypothetical protein
LGAITLELEHNESQEMKAIELILDATPSIKFNPLSDLSNDTLKKALALLEEYSEEIAPGLKEP